VVELVGYRLAGWDTPFWVLPNRRAGRYNEPGAGSTQYLSLHPLTPWAEYMRNEGIVAEQDAAEARPPLWAARVLLAEEPPRIDFDTAADWGLSSDELVADDRSACQRLARELRADPLAPDAFIAVSAALAGTENLVILAPRVMVSYLLEPLDPLDLPASVAAEEGRAPPSLPGLVHHFGSAGSHPGLAAWRRGETYEFAEPSTAHLAA
jgi:hypothetical protein